MWLNEKAAAERIGYKPETLRRYVKAGKLKITFTHLNGRNFKYLERDIIKVFNENASKRVA